MSWTVFELKAEDIVEMLTLEENHFRDFKDKDNVAKISKTASAFANADGGELFIGVRDREEDDRLSRLFINQEQANGCVASVYDLFADGPEFISCRFLKVDTRGLVLYIVIQKTPFVVKSSEGRVFKRQNAQDREVKAPTEIARLELEKGVEASKIPLSKQLRKRFSVRQYSRIFWTMWCRPQVHRISSQKSD